MKRLQALIAATVVTGLVAVCMLAIGLSAWFDSLDHQSASVKSTPAEIQNVSASVDVLAQYQQREQQYQQLIQQYQEHEQQYQTQLAQAQAEVQQYQQVLIRLQQLGVISIGRDGTIRVHVDTGVGG